MYDLNSLSLDALLKIAMKSDLVRKHRKTDWVVVMTVDDQELMMNHGNARIFLQGLIYGAALSNRRRRKSNGQRDGWVFGATGPARVVVG